MPVTIRFEPMERLSFWLRESIKAFTKMLPLLLFSILASGAWPTDKATPSPPLLGGRTGTNRGATISPAEAPAAAPAPAAKAPAFDEATRSPSGAVLQLG